MKRLLCEVIITMFVILQLPALAQEGAHLELVIDDRVTIDGEIDLVEQGEYSAYEIHLPDLTLSEDRNELALADLLFKDKDSPREHLDERKMDLEETWGIINRVKNAEGEAVNVSNNGSMGYSIEPLTRRYESASWRIWTYARNPSHKTNGTSYTREEVSGEHEYMTTKEAIELGQEFISKVLCEFESVHVEVMAINHDQLRIVYDELVASGRLEVYEDWVREPDNWGPADDIYIINYSLAFNGLPIMSDEEILRLPSRNVDGGELSWGMSAEVHMNRDGVYFMTANTVSIDKELEPRTVLTREQAIDRLTEMVTEVIHPLPLNITGGRLKYLATFDPSDYNKLTLSPVWCFESEQVAGEERFEGLTYVFDAYTGEEIR